MKTPPSPAAVEALRNASLLMSQGRYNEAVSLLAPLARAEPRTLELRRYLGGALQGAGDAAGAERELKAAVDLDRKNALAWTGYADLLAAMGRLGDAERAYRSALALDRRLMPAALGLGRLLNESGRPQDAAKVLIHAAARPDAHPAVMAQYAAALEALGRIEEVADIRLALIDRQPADPGQLHVAAVTLAQLGRFEQAEGLIQRALSGAGGAADILFTQARILRALNRFEEAEAAAVQAVARQPLFTDALKFLSELIWMRTADADQATAPLDAAIARHPGVADLHVIRAKLVEYAGDPRRAYALLTGPGAPMGPSIDVTASQAALHFDSALALDHARRAAALAPGDRGAVTALVDAALAAGLPDEARAAADSLLARDPLDQQALALRATALRMAGDEAGWRALYDYEAMVRPAFIETPKGWPDLESFLADLAASLRRLHGLKTHPVGQSLRHGTQTNVDLLAVDDPAIKALFRALDAPIRRYMSALPPGRDPLRRRNTGRYSIAGAWSIQLQPNGFHENHYHPEGWLSSAFYVDLPDATRAGGKEGWIKFGQPGIPTTPPLEPEHYVQPEPGKLVLFPSYMWHGTVPFGGDQPRLTVAFDVVPA